MACNVHFVSGLMESGVEFVAVDMPTANRLTAHILAAVAQHERGCETSRKRNSPRKALWLYLVSSGIDRGLRQCRSSSRRGVQYTILTVVWSCSSPAMTTCYGHPQGLSGCGNPSLLDKDKPLVVYRALKVRIQAIARKKYRKRLRDEDGVVVVCRKDLGAV